MDNVATAARQTDEYDEPLAGLPQSGPMTFANHAHIDGATAEVRFVTASSALPESVATRVWEAVGGKAAYPLIVPQSMGTQTVTFTPNGADAQVSVINGWRLTSADESVALALFPGLIALQTNAYERYSKDLGGPLTAALEAYASETNATTVNRIGLRYINRLTHSEAHGPQFWSTAINAPFAGPLRSEELGTHVQGMHQQLDLKLTDVAAARVISGAFEQDETAVGRFGYVIDIDVFRNEAIPFDTGTVSNLARQLNRTALSLFRLVLSDQMQDVLGAISKREDYA